MALTLQPGSAYSCYATAFNSFTGEPGTCSTAWTLRTPAPPTSVATVATTHTTWAATWVDGTVGTALGGLMPEYNWHTAKCVLPGQACTTASQGTPAHALGGQPGAVVTNLVPSTTYDCYVAVGSWKDSDIVACSGPVIVTTEPAPSPSPSPTPSPSPLPSPPSCSSPFTTRLGASSSQRMYVNWAGRYRDPFKGNGMHVCALSRQICVELRRAD